MRKHLHLNARGITIFIASIACWSIGTAKLGASDPIGVYAVIEKIVLEPAQGSPERIQIWGAFALSDTRNQDDYHAPQKGYLYYSCTPAQLDTCRKEWADLQSVAGKGVGVGFGGRHIANGRVRNATDTPASPDVYPIRMGVFRTDSRGAQPAVIEKLKAALAAR
jgi:hypothetical protein